MFVLNIIFGIVIVGAVGFSALDIIKTQLQFRKLRKKEEQILETMKRNNHAMKFL